MTQLIKFWVILRLSKKNSSCEPTSAWIVRYTGSYLIMPAVFTGNLGTSLLFQRPVLELISERYLATVQLALVAMLLAAFLGIPLGVMGALNRGTSKDLVCMSFSLLGVAIPNFWLGPMLILVFSVYLGVLPVSEKVGLASFVLPALTLGTSLAAFLSRVTRSAVLEHCNSDYIRTARAKGSSPFSVVFKHLLRNASLPIVTVFGLQFGVLLTGAIVTEKIFDWPGLGTLMLEALGNRDYPVVQGCVLIFAATYLFVNLATDLFSAKLDPRIEIGNDRC